MEASIMALLGRLTVQDYILLAIICCEVIRRIGKALGWDKTVMVVDELRSAITKAQIYIQRMRETPSESVNIGKATGTIAANVAGVTKKDVEEMVMHLATGDSYNAKGIAVSVMPDGEVKVDASGLAAKVTYKVGKFLGKVF